METFVDTGGSARMKGAAFAEFVRWYRDGYGESALVRAFERMPMSTRSIVDAREPSGGIIASRWYDVYAIHRLLDSITEGLTRKQRDELVREGGRATIERTLTGIYRVVFSAVATPERYARHAQTVWRSYSTSGVQFVRQHGPRHHEGVMRDWSGHHPILCDLNIAAGQRMYEMMGCKDVSITQTSCVAKGGATCAGDVTWR